MTETGVENQLCTDCGADIRAEALYCYNCGAAIDSVKIPAGPKTRAPAVSSVWFEEDIVNKDEESGEAQAAPVSADKVPSEGIPKPLSALVVEPEKDKRAPKRKKTKSKVRRKPEFASASAYQRKMRRDRKMEIEVVWQERERSPNIWFIVMSLLVSLLAFGLFVLAMYLK